VRLLAGAFFFFEVVDFLLAAGVSLAIFFQGLGVVFEVTVSFFEVVLAILVEGFFFLDGVDSLLAAIFFFVVFFLA